MGSVDGIPSEASVAESFRVSEYVPDKASTLPSPASPRTLLQPPLPPLGAGDNGDRNGGDKTGLLDCTLARSLAASAAAAPGFSKWRSTSKSSCVSVGGSSRVCRLGESSGCAAHDEEPGWLGVEERRDLFEEE